MCFLSEFWCGSLIGVDGLDWFVGDCQVLGVVVECFGCVGGVLVDVQLLFEYGVGCFSLMFFECFVEV